APSCRAMRQAARSLSMTASTTRHGAAASTGIPPPPPAMTSRSAPTSPPPAPGEPHPLARAQRPPRLDLDHGERLWRGHHPAVAAARVWLDHPAAEPGQPFGLGGVAKRARRALRGAR